MDPAAGHDRHRYSADDRTPKRGFVFGLQIPENQEFCRLAVGSHKKGQRRAGFTEEARNALFEIELMPDDSIAVPLPMKAGQCLVFSCWTYHRSDGNHPPDRDRRILFIRYANAVEVYNNGQPRLGRVVRGTSRLPKVMEFETNL